MTPDALDMFLLNNLFESLVGIRLVLYFLFCIMLDLEKAFLYLFIFLIIGDIQLNLDNMQMKDDHWI